MAEHPAPNDRRFPRGVYGVGSDPDPRFSLANERTFLAWIRTALALIAAGVAAEALEVPTHPTLRAVVAVVLVVLGAFAAAQALLRWAVGERAMRQRRSLPGGGALVLLGAVLATGVVVAAVLALLGS